MNTTDFLEKGLQYMRAYRMLPWMIGDVVLQFIESKGESAWQTISEIVDAEEIALAVLKDYIYLAEKFPADNGGKKYRLSYEVSIWKFKEVASLGVDEGLALLRKARKNGWDTKRLRAEAKAQRQGTKV